MMTVVAVLVAGALGLAGCAADAAPTDGSSDVASNPDPQSESQLRSPSASPSGNEESVPKVDDGDVGLATKHLPPAQRCYNNCIRGGLRDDFCSSACGW